MNLDGIPVIRLQLEGMKATVLHALLEYEAQLSSETRAAVERFCAPENIRAVIDREVSAVISTVIRDEVDSFYRTGQGRQIIRRAVQETLGEQA